MTPRILVVEDEPLQANAIVRALRLAGAEGVVAHTLEAAAEVLSTTRVDALTVDLGLPDGDGFTLLESSAARPLPALVISGELDRELLRRAHALGAAYVQKPLGVDELAAFVTRVRRGHRDAEASVRHVADEWAVRYRLTTAETEVLHARAGGASRGELAAARSVTSATIDRQVKDLLGKTGDTTLDAAVARLLREALSRSHEV